MAQDLTKKNLVLLVDDEVPIHRFVHRKFASKTDRFEFLAVKQMGEVFEVLKKRTVKVILLDIYLDDETDGVDGVQQLRDFGYKNIICMYSGDVSPRMLFQAALAGADDYIAKAPGCDLVGEVERLVEMEQVEDDGQEGEVFTSAFFKSRGLSASQIKLLDDFCKFGYPRVKEFACQLDIPESTLWKRLARIRSKLDVDCMSQVTHVLAAIELFSRRQKKRKTGPSTAVELNL